MDSIRVRFRRITNRVTGRYECPECFDAVHKGHYCPECGRYA